MRDLDAGKVCGKVVFTLSEAGRSTAVADG